MFSLGFLVGNLVLAPLADKFGRIQSINLSINWIIIINFLTLIFTSSALLYLLCLLSTMMIAVFIGNTLVYIL